jgi:hypothetical protein
MSESTSHADDTDYNFWNAAVRKPTKTNVNRKPYTDRYLSPD